MLKKFMKTGKEKLLIIVFANLFWGCIFANTAEVKTEPAKIALIGFRVERGLDQSLADKLQLLIFSQVASTDKLEMLERKQLKKIVEEHDLSMSGLVSSKTQLRLGLLAGADFVVSGRIYKINDDLYINAKAINAKTTKVFGVFKAYGKEKKMDVALEDFAKAVTSKLIEKCNKKRSNPQAGLTVKYNNRTLAHGPVHSATHDFLYFRNVKVGRHMAK